MKAWLRGFYYSFPIQLLFLHFRKYQVLLLFWFVLFSTVSGSFMKNFGADSLYLAPEYLGNVNPFSTALVGLAVGMFIMSWNVTTFVLFSKHFRFLAATTNPFLKYCINNSVIPILFLLFYFYRAFDFGLYKELISILDFLLLVLGFLGGLFAILSVSFFYFFRADRSILRRMMPTISNPHEYITHLNPLYAEYDEGSLVKAEWYFETPRKLRRTRNVSHYTRQFIDSIFKRHHFAAIIAVFIAFIVLIITGFFLEYSFFQIPAAASITIFFSILIGVAGAFAYFLQSWSVPYLILLILLLNLFYQLDWIDPRNKAYGLNYGNKKERPLYTRENLEALCNEENTEADKKNMLRILENWKKKQDSGKPVMILINTSGGGHRSATFTMRILQELDSLSSGELLKKTFLINGASGGMMGATYFRELYMRRQKGDSIRLQDNKYVENISGDLLNPIFSSFVTRDLISPAQKFSVGPYSYVKDRGYAFEEKLNKNTNGFLNKRLGDYAEAEKNAEIPLMFFNSVISRDGRKMLISTQPVRFMMRSEQDTLRIPSSSPDAIDFVSFFEKQNPYNLRILTALRMNATFPIVLPTVWLPSAPVIDVMDGGLRDNYGQETTLRFLETFEDWISKNTGAVLILQITDRETGAWEMPYVSENIGDHAVKPFLLLQHNWFKMMEYFQSDMLTYYSQSNKHKIHKIIFQYATSKEENKAALSFHLSQREKNDIFNSVNLGNNVEAFQKVIQLLSIRHVDSLTVE